MDEDVIDALANALLNARNLAGSYRNIDDGLYEVINNACVEVAFVINAETPTYDLRYFYRAAGYPEPYPIHDLE